MGNSKTKPDKSTDKYKQLLQLTSAVRSDDYGNNVYLWLDNIDSKTSGLLTHVSIMMAVTALLWQEFPAGSVYRLIASIELIFYIFISIGCLFCIDIIFPKKNVETNSSLQSYAMSVLKFRLRAYKACLYGTGITTIALLAVLGAHLYAR